MFRRLLFLAVLLVFANRAAADQVTLANGDRITGTVTSLAGGTLTVTTPNGGLRIPWSTTTGLVIDDPILATVGNAAPVEVRIAASDAAGRVVLNPGGPAELAQIGALTRPMPAITVEGGANAGMVATGGNADVSAVRLDGDITVRQLANRYTAAAALNRLKDKGVETADNWNTALNYDRFLTERLFLNGNAIFTNDRFRDLDLRTALGVGLGYQVIQTPRVRLTANGGLGWVDENFDVAEDESYTAARESATLDIFIVPCPCRESRAS